ncbi:MAG: hypothetical protein ACRYFX_19040 [Janthinobacterium lividum]
MVTWLKNEPEKYPTAPLAMLCWASSINLHFTDFFGYADSCSVKLEDEDFHWAVPFIEKWGPVGMEAVGCLLLGGPDFLPIEPHRNANFMAARAALQELNPTVVSKQD